MSYRLLRRSDARVSAGRSAPLRKQPRESVRPDRPNALNLRPAVGAGGEQATNAPEPRQQGTRRLGRDAGHGRENLHPGRDQFDGTSGTSSRGCLSRVTHCETMKPKRGIGSIATPENRDPKLDDGKQSSSNRVGMPRPDVKLISLHEQERRDRLVTDLPDLLPQPSAAERSV